MIFDASVTIPDENLESDLSQEKTYLVYQNIRQAIAPGDWVRLQSIFQSDKLYQVAACLEDMIVVLMPVQNEMGDLIYLQANISPSYIYSVLRRV